MWYRAILVCKCFCTIIEVFDKTILGLEVILLEVVSICDCLRLICVTASGFDVLRKLFRHLSAEAGCLDLNVESLLWYNSLDCISEERPRLV